MYTDLNSDSEQKKKSVSVDNVEVWKNFRPVVRGKKIFFSGK